MMDFCVKDNVGMMKGRMLGKRTRGRRRIQLIDDLLAKKY